jgi:DNA-binding IclR family transcriptional regulator
MSGDEDFTATARLPESGSVKSATRVLDLFEFLSRWDSEKTHAEIAEDLGIPKSSLTQLLRTLERRGYLIYSYSSKGYQLGPSIAKLAKRVNDGNELIAIAASTLDWLTRETGETSALNVMKGDKTEVVATVTGAHRLTYTMKPRDEAPLYATSGGRAILANLPDEMIEEYCTRVTFEKFAAATIASVSRLREELNEIRRTGIAFVYEEFTPGINGIAVPILTQSGFPLGSINTAIPVSRYTQEKRSHCVASIQKAVNTVRTQMRLLQPSP